MRMWEVSQGKKESAYTLKAVNIVVLLLPILPKMFLTLYKLTSHYMSTFHWLVILPVFHYSISFHSPIKQSKLAKQELGNV